MASQKKITVKEERVGDKAKILVVDDEILVCKSISSALEPERYIVDMALSGEEALKKEAKGEYDVIVADLMMPGISGMELLREVKQKRTDVKVIMITGYPSIKSAVESIRLGAFDYIPKPFTPNDLRSLVSRALESRRYREREASVEARPREEEKEEIFVPQGLYCIAENSWVLEEQDGNVRVGIHHVFLRTIGEITSIDLPQENEIRYQGEACSRVTDSHMHVHRVWTPVSGKVIAVHEEIKKDCSKLVKDPYKEGWILLMAPIHLEDDLRNLVLLKAPN